jgi:preprotein translocase subunit SecB
VEENSYKLLKLYLRDLSVESPLTGRMPQRIAQPSIDINIDPMISRVADDQYEVAARFTVSARGNGVHLYLVEMTQVGWFSLAPSDEAHRQSLLRRVLPQLIFPAARNNLASFIVAAGYQPVVLDHIQLESLFARAEIVDKRPPPPAPVPAPLAEKQADAARAASSVAAGRRLWPVALAGCAALVLLLSQVDRRGSGGKDSAPQAEKQMPVVPPIAAASPTQVASVSAVAQNEVPGPAIAQLEKTGSDWLAAQNKDAYTVELLRTSDLKSAEDVAPIERGLPLFLLRLHGQGGAQYAVLSGTYGSRELAVQAAAASAVYRAVRFGDVE